MNSTMNHALIAPEPEVACSNGSGRFEELVSIVVPVYNEEDSVRALYASVKAATEELGRPWELIFVDDGSKDHSPEVMEAISHEDSHVTVVKLRRNFGQTAALSAGIDHSRGSIIVPMDGDLQNDPADIPRLLSKLDEGFDVVSGWRKSRKDPISKTLPSFFANKLASWVTGVRLHDFGCTLKAYRWEALEGVRLYGEFHRFIPALAHAVGAKVTEIEVTHHHRRFGKSKYGIGRVIRVILDLVTLKLLLTYYTRPMRIFGSLGFLMLGMGALSGMVTLLMKLVLGTDMTGNPLLFMTILGIISGIQLIGLGFLGEINMRTYYETQRKPIYVVKKVVRSEG